MKQVVVIAGPSGSGKNSVIDALIVRYPHLERLVTATTRSPRDGEKNGVDYHFLSKKDFATARDCGDILEFRYVPALDTYYGAYKPDLEKRLALGSMVVAHLDIVGARYLKEHYNATTIFILPDSFERLAERVRERDNSMSDVEISERMRIARIEVDEHSAEYDYTLVNENGKLTETVDNVIAILKKEGYNLE
jgi:guanylate kinase